jgi:hypothetical protein
LFVRGGAFFQPLHPLFQMQGYEQGRVPALRPVVHVGEPVLSPAQPAFIEISPCLGYLYDYACHRVHSRGSILDDRFVGESSQ